MAPQISGLGIDIAPLVCHVLGMDNPGHAVLHTRLLRGDWLSCIATLSPLRMAMRYS